MAEGLLLGADVGGSAVKWVLRSAGGPAGEGEVPTDPRDPAGTLARLHAAARAGLAPGRSLAAVGLACAGIVDDARGRLGRSPNLPGWQDRELGADVRAAFPGLPAVLANDVNAALYGEWRLGAGRGCRDAVMIALGTGVGGGVVCDGRLLVGARCAAGEIGHMVLDPRGAPCACGNRGCLEAYAGTVGLRRRAAELARDPGASAALRDLVAAKGEQLGAADLHALAQAGDAGARGLFAEAGRWLGQAVANCVNVLDPDVVIVGGGVARAGELILGPCRETARGLIMAAEAREVRIVPAELGPWAAAIGAAELARGPREAIG